MYASRFLISNYDTTAWLLWIKLMIYINWIERWVVLFLSLFSNVLAFTGYSASSLIIFCIWPLRLFWFVSYFILSDCFRLSALILLTVLLFPRCLCIISLSALSMLYSALAMAMVSMCEHFLCSLFRRSNNARHLMEKTHFFVLKHIDFLFEPSTKKQHETKCKMTKLSRNSTKCVHMEQKS